MSLHDETAAELIRWCEARANDDECGYYWQSKFRRIAVALGGVNGERTAIPRVVNPRAEILRTEGGKVLRTLLKCSAVLGVVYIALEVLKIHLGVA